MDGPQTTPEKPSLLPVPWSSPWKQLRQDLARDLPAVGSASVLRLRELWRRNREGDLSVPGFWPQALSAWFWPNQLVQYLLIAIRAGNPVILASFCPQRPIAPHKRHTKVGALAGVRSPVCVVN